MKNSPPSLLARARAYASQRAGRTALTVAPLAALGLSAENASAIAVAGPTFSPSGTLTYGATSPNDSFISKTSGSLSGSALATGSNGIAGAKYQGSVGFTEVENSTAGFMGSIQAFNISGSASGTLNSTDSTIPLYYDFTLATTAGANGGTLTIRGWTLTLSVTTTGTGGGTGTQIVTNTTGGPGTFSGPTSVSAPGAASGSTLSGYTGVLTINYTANTSNSAANATLSVTVPANSIDFNTLVPEPSSWVILSAGVVGAGLYIMRVRPQRAKDAPAI